MAFGMGWRRFGWSAFRDSSNSPIIGSEETSSRESLSTNQFAANSIKLLQKLVHVVVIQICTISPNTVVSILHTWLPLFPIPDSISFPRCSAFASCTLLSALRSNCRGECHVRRKLPKLVPNHVLRDGHMVVVLAVVNLERESHKVGQNRRRPCLCSYRGDFLALLRWPHDREAIEEVRSCVDSVVGEILRHDVRPCVLCQ